MDVILFSFLNGFGFGLGIMLSMLIFGVRIKFERTRVVKEGAK